MIDPLPSDTSYVFSDEELTCWVCCDGAAAESLLPMGCACRGSAGFAHLLCLVSAARHNVDSWTTCPTCKQYYTGEVDVGLAKARWNLVHNRPDNDEERLFVANNLAVALKESADDNEGALTIMKDVLAIRRRALGDEHPSTLDSMTNLALQHTEMGDFQAALVLNAEAVDAMRRTLGEDHEHTLHAVGSMAALLNHMGSYEQARPLHEDVLEARRRTLGEDHLDVMNSRFNLGQCCLGLNKRKKGLTHLRKAASTARKVLGVTHPSTQHFVSGLEEAEDYLSAA